MPGNGDRKRSVLNMLRVCKRTPSPERQPRRGQRCRGQPNNCTADRRLSDATNRLKGKPDRHRQTPECAPKTSPLKTGSPLRGTCYISCWNWPLRICNPNLNLRVGREGLHLLLTMIGGRNLLRRKFQQFNDSPKPLRFTPDSCCIDLPTHAVSCMPCNGICLCIGGACQP